MSKKTSNDFWKTSEFGSKQWFDGAFADSNVPEPLRRFSESLCSQYTIRGICDPMYVANVAGVELGVGDGCGTFGEFDSDRVDSEKIHRLAKRLVFSYSTCISAGGGDVGSIEKLATDCFGRRPRLAMK